jgi:hypothetical protein
MLQGLGHHLQALHCKLQLLQRGGDSAQQRRVQLYLMAERCTLWICDVIWQCLERVVCLQKYLHSLPFLLRKCTHNDNSL